MKINIIAKICLVSAALLIGGFLIVRAVGFVSYEDDNKFIFWDNVRLANQGLDMAGQSAVSPGDLSIGSGKDLYVRKFMGFGCAGYPDTSCATTIGDVGGGTFLTIPTLSGGPGLVLKSVYSGIELQAASGATINLSGQVVLTDSKNLIVTDKTVPSNTSSVFVNNLRTNNISGSSISSGALTLPNLEFASDAVFNTDRRINISL